MNNNDVEEISDKLFKISLIKEGETYSYLSNSVEPHNSYYTSLKRTYYGENRKEMLKFIISYFDKAQELLFNIDEWKKKDLIILMKRALNGLENLSVTYSSDKDFAEKILNLINHIREILSYGKEKDKELFKKKKSIKEELLSKWSKKELENILSDKVKSQAFICASLCAQKLLWSLFIF